MNHNPQLLHRLLRVATAALMLTATAPLQAFATDSDKAADHAPIAATPTFVTAPMRTQPAFSNEESGLLTEDVTLDPMHAAVLDEIDIGTFLDAPAVFEDSFDLRTKGLVPAVRDQGMHGTCWAHGLLASMESALMLYNAEIDLSEYHLSYYSYWGDNTVDCSFDPFDAGGFDFLGISALSMWYGPVYEHTVPYDNYDFDSMDDAAHIELRDQADFHVQDVYTVASYQDDNTLDVTASQQVLKALLKSNHAVSVSYLADSYYYNAKTASYYCPTRTYANHAVTLIGWDDHYAKENFRAGAQPQHDGAWLIKNSWGTEAEQNGYCWISYEDQTLYQFSCVFAERSDNYAAQQGYDSLGWQTSVSAGSTESKVGYLSSVFTAQEDTAVCAAAFYTTDNNAAYEITVYTDLADKTDPTSGTPSTVTTGTEVFAGYHTVDLTNAVSVDEGEPYAVVVKLTNPVNAYPIAAEAALCFTEQVDGKTVSEFGLIDNEKLEAQTAAGQSFISADGKQWSDTKGQTFAYGDYYRDDEAAISSVVNGFHAAKREEQPAVPFHSEAAVRQRANALSDAQSVSTMPIDIDISLGDVCLKAFTNPEKHVTISEISDDIAFGSTITLTSNDAAEIYYTQNDGEATRYTAPIVIDADTTICAWGVTDGVAGETTERTFYQKSARISALTMNAPSGSYEYPVAAAQNDPSFEAKAWDESISFFANTTATPMLGDKPFASDNQTDPLPLQFGENNFVISAQGDGMHTSEYTVCVNRAYASVDYEKQIICFDPAFCTVTDQSGNALKPDQDILSYADQELIVTITETGKTQPLSVGSYPNLDLLDIGVMHYDSDCPIGPFLPDDPTFSFLQDAQLTFYPGKSMEQTVALMDFLLPYETALTADADDASGIYALTALSPGDVLEIYVPVTDHSFASKVLRYQIPEAPAMPDCDMTDVAVTETSITLNNPGDGLEYALEENWLFDFDADIREQMEENLSSLCFIFNLNPNLMTMDSMMDYLMEFYDVPDFDGVVYELNRLFVLTEEWQDSPAFVDLVPGTRYDLVARIPGTDESFASKECIGHFTTAGERPAVYLDCTTETLAFDTSVYQVTYTFPEDTILYAFTDYAVNVLDNYIEVVPTFCECISFEAGTNYVLNNMYPIESFFLGKEITATPLDATSGLASYTTTLPTRSAAPSYTMDLANGATNEVIAENDRLYYCYAMPTTVTNEDGTTQTVMEDIEVDYSRDELEQAGYLNAEGELDLTMVAAQTISLYTAGTLHILPSERCQLFVPNYSNTDQDGVIIEDSVPQLQYTTEGGCLLVTPVENAEYAVTPEAENGNFCNIEWTEQTFFALKPNTNYLLSIRLKGDAENMPSSSNTIFFGEAERAAMTWYARGDLNGDGKIDVNDAVIVLKAYAAAILGRVEITDAQEYYADINHDGAVDLTDAIRILKFYAVSLLNPAVTWDDILR